VTVASDQPDTRAIAPGHDAETIMLYFVQPAVAGGGTRRAMAGKARCGRKSGRYRKRNDMAGLIESRTHGVQSDRHDYRGLTHGRMSRAEADPHSSADRSGEAISYHRNGSRALPKKHTSGQRVRLLFDTETTNRGIYVSRRPDG
jgi:hypothetical protein